MRTVDYMPLVLRTRDIAYICNEPNEEAKRPTPHDDIISIGPRYSSHEQRNATNNDENGRPIDEVGLCSRSTIEMDSLIVGLLDCWIVGMGPRVYTYTVAMRGYIRAFGTLLSHHVQYRGGSFSFFWISMDDSEGREATEL
jgi:hypothetical protein